MKKLINKKKWEKNVCSEDEGTGKKAQLGPTGCFSLSCGFYRYCVNRLEVIYLQQLVPLLTETVSSTTTLRIRNTTQSSKQGCPS